MSKERYTYDAEFLGVTTDLRVDLSLDLGFGDRKVVRLPLTGVPIVGHSIQLASLVIDWISENAPDNRLLVETFKDGDEYSVVCVRNFKSLNHKLIHKINKGQNND